MLTEREVQQAWALGLFGRRGLRTEDGRPLDIEFPGFPGAAGPDFRAARLVLGGDPVEGDVELHLVPSGWSAHAHGAQHAYANVVLHVALRRDAFPSPARTVAGRAIPELVLEPHLAISELELRRLLAAPAAPPPGGAEGWLAQLGDRRFERRAARLARAAAARGPDEALYRELMAGLGWSANKAPFAELARLVPWRLVAGRPAAEILAAFEAASRSLPWRLAGVRPANRPERRRAGMAALVAALAGRPLAAAARVASSPAAFFDPSGLGLIGPARSAELWTGVLLPALGRHAAFAAHPPLPENHRTREARHALGLPPPATLRHQWGLMEWRADQG
jgi:hypothetical protein